MRNHSVRDTPQTWQVTSTLRIPDAGERCSLTLYSPWHCGQVRWADPHLDDRRRGDLDRPILGAADRQRRELLAIAHQLAHHARALALLGALPSDHDAVP
jgi:hypothetical protein